MQKESWIARDNKRPIYRSWAAVVGFVLAIIMTLPLTLTVWFK